MRSSNRCGAMLNKYNVGAKGMEWSVVFIAAFLRNRRSSALAAGNQSNYAIMRFVINTRSRTVRRAW